ncbi:RES family NAD+ phosphorylase [Flavobacterium taihuense]|uniref:RES family NAD+ phosphorylase n=1 Tax=Flavobacterium taihuense TaxID=2857508 RepID=A0ABS6XUB6_9FLAO|nr:RES family NAD+ phosphorylase [Flavobacterium taihuense]MBW4360267.1 RES family NAD+ phosphorylase [Flavobacterium taihuense]
MEVFRLARKKYPIELSGKGASISGARWNSKGTEIIYCAQNRALAMAEVLVHLSLATLPNDFVMLTIDIPDTILVEVLDLNKVNLDWNVFPCTFETPLLGDDFIKRNKACVLKVPSAVVKGDFNFLINPYHFDFYKIKIIEQADFPFDKRIFK